MPVRQLSYPSSSASPISISETTTLAMRVLVTAGESGSGAVGSSTTISISEPDMDTVLSAYQGAWRVLPSALVFSADEQLLIKLDTALISLASIGMPVTLYPCRADAVLPTWFEAASPVEGQILHTTRGPDFGKISRIAPNTSSNRTAR